MRQKFLVSMTGAALFVAACMPALAHHAFGGEFDPNRPVLLKGKVTKVEWVNPHSWIHLEVTKPDGTKEEWMVEGGSPNSLLRRGVTRDSLPVGTDIVVDGYQARDHTQLKANGRNVTFADGRKLFLGSSGPGEPPSNAVPTDQAKPK
jgi:uncharacterized protein DUF6152